MDINNIIMHIRESFLGDYCLSCQTPCCCDNSELRVEHNELSLFLEYRIPTYRKVGGVIDWLDKRKSIILDSGSNPIKKPSLVNVMDIYYVLYSDGACPFYDKGCKVHDDFRRPKLCKQYPYIGIQGGDSVLVSESCSAFRKKEVRDIFFRKYGFKIVSASSTCD